MKQPRPGDRQILSLFVILAVMTVVLALLLDAVFLRPVPAGSWFEMATR